MPKIKETEEEKKAREKREFFEARDVERKERKAKKDAEIHPSYAHQSSEHHHGHTGANPGRVH